MNTVLILGAPVVKKRQYVALTKKIIEYFKVCGLQEVIVFFPRDLMKWDLGKEMTVCISGPYLDFDRGSKQALAAAVGLIVRRAFEPKKISCSVQCEPTPGEGHWSYPHS